MEEDANIHGCACENEIQRAEAAKHWQEVASLRFDRLERAWLLGLRIVLVLLLIIAALASAGLTQMVFAAGAIRSVVLVDGRQVLRPRRRSRVM